MFMPGMRSALALSLLGSMLLLMACGDPGSAPALSPTARAVPTPGSSPTPATISWDEAERLIRDCRVAFVMQAHSLDVWLDLDDGSRVKAVEPRIDVVFDVVSDAVESGCPQIPLATE